MAAFTNQSKLFLPIAHSASPDTNGCISKRRENDSRENDQEKMKWSTVTNTTERRKREKKKLSLGKQGIPNDETKWCEQKGDCRG